MLDSSTDAKICAQNLSSPSIPMMRGISTTQFTLRRSRAAGALGCTLLMSRLTWSLPDRVIPMLPERLSNGVCSLNPGVDRFTHSVFIHFDKHGTAKSARFTHSIIRSAHRLTYKQAYAI